MKLVLVKPDTDFKEINGVMHVSTKHISVYINLKEEQLKKEYINGFELADLIVRLSFLNPRKMDLLLKLIDLAKILSPELNKLNFLCHSVTTTIMKNFMDSSTTERDVQLWFIKNVKSIVGDSFEIAELKSNAKNRPDAWLKKEEELIPVEMKLHEFNSKALKQLIRYMNYYKCSSGIAVGKRLDCVLPEGITFVKYDLLSS